VSETEAPPKQFKCGQCGGTMEFAPGQASLACPFCGFANAVPQSEEDVEELDFHAYLQHAADEEEAEEHHLMKCGSCGGETTFRDDVAADLCPFCGSDLIKDGGSSKAIKPKSLLPFKVAREAAREAFRSWLSGLWFAPNKLKQFARVESPLSGIYIPYWTYDADTTSFYRGQRGDDYWVTESYTTRENGKTVRKTRQVRKTRWRHVSGVVYESFNDILVLASRTLPRRCTEKLEPWDLQNLEPYSPEFLSGFRTEQYQVDLETGFGEAREVMDQAIHSLVRRDIGGDHQRIHSVRTQHDNVTFKHILLPVWVSAYRYGEKVYRFLVNARTGEVQGERPWSWVKILLLVLTVALAVAGGVYLRGR